MATARAWASVGEITEKALDLDTDHRSAYLDHACGPDADLRRNIERLLEADRNAGAYLAEPAAADLAPAWLDGAPSASHRQRIGPYRILRPLGAGGVGDVFLAARADDQYEQNVAIKVLRHRPGSDDAKRRIIAERQILARLEHPNIARLYDGGTTEDGLPYLVMEYVAGLPIDDYCYQHRLTLDDRLDLFADLCSAVQFAHQNFVVHRDLKPSNILVTYDGVLKLLDFSIAKAIGSAGDRLIDQTATGSTPMTLAYASPEQIDGEPATAATDVHGLGIMLYRMLTGCHPFPTDGKPLHEVAQVVSRYDPLPPSRAVALAPDLAGADDPTSPALATKSLEGDLDAITLKALAKLASERYSSAEQLAADLERHRHERPIRAHPPTLGYRLRKAVLRHRAACLLATAASILILVFVLALVTQTRRANAEADRAGAQAERAQREAQSAEDVADFLIGIISASPEAVTASEMLDWSHQRAQRYFEHQPESQGRILESIGVAYERIGRYDSAAQVFDEALAVRSEVHGEDSLEFAETLRHQARLLMTVGDFASATEIVRRSLSIIRSSPEPDELAVAEVLHTLGGLYLYQGRVHEAEIFSREALRLRRLHLGADHSYSIGTLNNLALVLHNKGEYEEAEQLLLETIAIRKRVHGADHPAMAIALNNLAEFYLNQGRIDDAEPLYLKALNISRKTLGEDHPRLGL
ncbi:MAG: serine/threonine-protein kinase, partial [Acidobacteriota bacterium]